MNIQLVKGQWEQMKGSLKQKYAKLTDDDLKYVEGKEEELFGRLQKKLGLTKDAVELIVKEHLANARKKAQGKP